MKYVIRKPYWNYEKEEKWLNEMSAKGYAMTDYSWCRYVFDQGPKGEYIYRIELLEHFVHHPESQEYIKFIEETGVQFVASYMRWVYFRKKAADGPFDLYTDLDSKIRHAKKVRLFWNTFAAIEFCAGGVNLIFGIISRIFEGKFISNFYFGIPLIALGFLFIAVSMPVRKKLKILMKEKKIRE